MSGDQHEQPIAAELRRIVGRWLRIRAEHIDKSVGIGGNVWFLSKHAQFTVLKQLANDADHSSLLTRLFDGEEPLPFDEWLERR